MDTRNTLVAEVAEASAFCSDCEARFKASSYVGNPPFSSSVSVTFALREIGSNFGATLVFDLELELFLLA